MTILDMINNSARTIVLASTLAALVSSACAPRNNRPELNPLRNNRLELNPEGMGVFYSLTDNRGVKEPVDIFLNGIINDRFVEDLSKDGKYPSGLGGWINNLQPGHYTLRIVYHNPESGDKQPNPLIKEGTFEIR